MKRSYLITVLSIAILSLGAFVLSCSSGDGIVWNGPDYPAGGIPEGEWTDSHALALTDDPFLSVIALNDFGEAIVLMTQLDTDRKIVDVEGVVWVGSSGDVFIIRFDENGWPSHSVFGDDVFFYANWDMNTVDIAVMHPDGTYEIFNDMDRSAAALLSPAAKPGFLAQPIKFEKASGEVVLEKLPEVGIRNSRSPYNLSPYGRSSMCYDYSSGYSIVPPRCFTDTGTPQSWVIWALFGTELGTCGIQDYPTMYGKDLPCKTDFIKNAVLAHVNPELMPFYVATTTGVDFGNVSPIADSIDIYQTARTASSDAHIKYYNAAELIEDVTIWAPFYFQGKQW